MRPASPAPHRARAGRARSPRRSTAHSTSHRTAAFVFINDPPNEHEPMDGGTVPTSANARASAERRRERSVADEVQLLDRRGSSRRRAGGRRVVSRRGSRDGAATTTPSNSSPFTASGLNIGISPSASSCTWSTVLRPVAGERGGDPLVPPVGGDDADQAMMMAQGLDRASDEFGDAGVGVDQHLWLDTCRTHRLGSPSRRRP